MLTICRSGVRIKYQESAGEGLCQTFCARQACDTSRFRSNVEYYGCLEPWNLEQVLCVEGNRRSWVKMYHEMRALTIHILCHSIYPANIHQRRRWRERRPSRVPGIFDGAVTSIDCIWIILVGHTGYTIATMPTVEQARIQRQTPGDESNEQATTCK